MPTPNNRPAKHRPVTGSQIGPDGKRRSFEELGIDPDVPVDRLGFHEGAGYKGGDPAPARDHRGEVIEDYAVAAAEAAAEGPSKDELYERATELGITNRSKMDKGQLAEAIAAHLAGSQGGEPAAEAPDGADATPVATPVDTATHGAEAATEEQPGNGDD